MVGVAPFGCTKCDNRWGGLLTAHCAAEGCHQTFTRLSGFDAHRQGSHARGRHCVHPTELGMVDAGRDYPCWGMPGTYYDEDDE